MARMHTCRDCGGRGKVKCWYCRGTGLRVGHKGLADPREDDPCPQCVDGTEVCEVCSGEGHWYNA